MSSLSPELELVVRRFYAEVLSEDSLFNNDARPLRGHAMRCCLELLGYTIYGDKIVRKAALDRGVTYGKRLDLDDVWEEDTKKVVEAVNESNKGTDTDKANSRKSSKDTKVWQAVLSEDV